MEEPVTMATMTSFAPNKTLEMPKSFVNTLKEGGMESSHAIMILNPSTRVIRITPTTSNEVVKLSIVISELSPDFLQALGKVLTRHKLKTLYSTGICFTQDTCSYEGYIDMSEFAEIPPDQMREEISKITGISQVNLEIISP